MAAQTGTGPTQTVWYRVDGLPPDTRLKLVFTNGTEVTGTVARQGIEALFTAFRQRRCRTRRRRPRRPAQADCAGR